MGSSSYWLTVPLPVGNDVVIISRQFPEINHSISSSWWCQMVIWWKISYLWRLVIIFVMQKFQLILVLICTITDEHISCLYTNWIQRGKSPTMQLVWSLNKTSQKIARHRNHVQFNLTFFNSGVTPQDLRLKTDIKSHKASNIIQRAERALLNKRIQQHNFTLGILKSKQQNLKDHIRMVYQKRHTIGSLITPNMRSWENTASSKNNRLPNSAGFGVNRSDWKEYRKTIRTITTKISGC